MKTGLKAREMRRKQHKHHSPGMKNHQSGLKMEHRKIKVMENRELNNLRHQQISLSEIELVKYVKS